MGRLGNFSYYKKTILSFIIVMLLPTIVMGAVFYYSFIDIMNTEVDRSSSELLKQITDSIDGRLEELDRLCIQIQNDPFISILRHPEVYADVTTAFKHLSSLSMSNSFISEYYIYLKDVPSVLSSSSTLNKDLFFPLLGVPGLDAEDRFTGYLSQLSKPVILSPRSVSSTLVPASEKYFIYIEPIPVNEEYKSGAMIFFISKSTMLKNLSSALASINGQVLLFDTDNKLLDFYGEGIANPSNINNAMSIESTGAAKEILIGRSRYIVSSATLKSSGWTITSIIPKGEITHKINRVRNKALFVFILTMLAGFIISYYLSNFNYKPIKELTDSASKYFGSHLQKTNDLQTVQSALDHMGQTINSLNQKIKLTTPSLKRDLIIDFLKGRYHSLDELNEVAQEIGIYLNGEMFSVSVFHIQDLKFKNSMNIIEYTENTLGSTFSVYGMEIPLENLIVFILAARPETIDCTTEAFESVQSGIKTCCDVDVTIGIGNWRKETKDAGISYLQALTAVDYRFVRGKNTVISFEEIQPVNFNQKYNPNQQLDSLVYNIVQGNVENVKKILSNIIHDIKAANMPLLLAKTICYSIINLLDSSLEKIRMGYKAQIQDYPDIFSLSTYESIDDLADKLMDLSQQVYVQLRSVNTIEDKRLIDRCFEYIEQNYANPDFSLNVMAESLNLSLSNLSHYFKSRTNESVSEYVRRIRIEKAKEYIQADNDSNLQTIALKVGYDNVARFIRNFKQCTGLTPSTYREFIGNGKCHL